MGKRFQHSYGANLRRRNIQNRLLCLVNVPRIICAGEIRDGVLNHRIEEHDGVKICAAR